MNDDELKTLWRQQLLRNPAPSATQLMSAMQNKMTELRRGLFWRDIRELAACVVIVIVFGYFSFNERAPISRLGYLIVVGSSVFIAWKLVHARRTSPPAPPGASIVESLRAELNSVRTQSRLLGSVLWWYLLPPGIGLLVATWGMPIHLHAKIPVTLIYVAVYGFVYWLNQWARSKELLPAEAQLQSLLRSIETGEPVDQTDASNLRPTALSIAAAGQVKPVEFKVAFWQLAIYGEIGFVGIWFFGTLSLTNFNVSRMFMPKHLVWLVPFFLGGLLYSWLIQLITRRAVGISALGIHLHKGLNLIPWDAINDVRPLRVLNVQSLWLIGESGEKRLMPWTSLERHSDLKSAVERYAPASHPIRKYLSLLRKA